MILTGDFRILSQDIADNSIDLILTDPVYDRIEDYRYLAEVAIRVLKPNRACLTFCGIGFLHETLDALRDGGLIYRWYIPHLTPGTKGYCDTGPSRQMAMLWLDNSGKTIPKPRLYDVVFTNGIQDYHIWRKNLSGIVRWVNSLTKPGDLVLDPFTGGGTTAVACKQTHRDFIGFEIDGDMAETARRRVANCQPPLPKLFVQQLALTTLCHSV